VLEEIKFEFMMMCGHYGQESVSKLLEEGKINWPKEMTYDLFQLFLKQTLSHDESRGDLTEELEFFEKFWTIIAKKDVLMEDDLVTYFCSLYEQLNIPHIEIIE